MKPDSKLGEVVFAHDYPFLRAPDGRVYSDRGDWPWQWYLDFAERVTVVSRMKELADEASLEALTLVSDPRVSYETIPSLSGPLLQFTNRSEARRRLRDALSRADALIARLPSEIGIVAVDAAERLGKPWGVEVVTCTWDMLWNYGTWQGKVYAPVSWWKTRRLVRRSPYAVYETHRFLQRRYPPGGKSVGCPTGLPEVDESVLDCRLACIESRRPPLRVGLIGALSVGFKGIDTAIEALGRRRDNLPEFEFRVLGTGDPARWRRIAQRAGLADRVHFDGVLPSGEPVDRWLDDIDLYIQPSFQEGLPRATLEAMSRGCPVLASTAGGLPELLEPECLHQPGDAERLGRLIVRAAGDRDWQGAQARRNFDLARRYSKPVLDRVRSEFWGDFAGRVRAGGATSSGAPSITFISPYAQLAGSERYLGLVLDGIPEERIRGVVFLQDGPAVDELRRRGREVTVIPTSARTRGILRSARGLRHLLDRDRPDIVHANGVKAALVAVLATLGKRTPVVWVKHDLSFDRSLARPLALGCGLVVGVSEAAVRVFKGPLRRRVRVVSNALPPVSADRTAGRRLVLETLGAPEDARVVALIGRLYAMKGQHELLEIVPDLVREFPEVRVAFVGQEDPAQAGYASALRRRASELDLGDSLTFVGRVEEAAAFAAGCDIVATPSVPAARGNTESFSLVALEAMSVGTPVVGYAEGGLPEVLGRCALLVPTGDRRALLGALVRALRDDELRSRLAACGRERSASEFSLERMLTELDACYLEAVRL